MKIGIIREYKQPADMRVPLTPKQCAELMKQFPNLKIVVESSPIRCYTDQEYIDQGVEVTTQLDDCDVLMGVKEVPIDKLIPNKKYLFFSHTIKKQPHNQKLLQAIIEKKIQLIDYECLKNSKNQRIIGFGHYAGFVGTYNGIRAYGKRYGLFDVKPANECKNRQELEQEFQKIKLPNIKIILTGNGRVAKGALEILSLLNIKRITPFQFVYNQFRQPVFAQLESNNYYEALDGSPWQTSDFYTNPQNYRSTFRQYYPHCDLLIHATYWDPKAPVLFTKEEMRRHNFRISVIADITCDIDGSIPSTMKASTIAAPFYGYNPKTETIDENDFSYDNITVMAVDNLPCELPRDASEEFGNDLVEKVIPALLGNDNEDIINRASITKNGELTMYFDYLADYVKKD